MWLRYVGFEFWSAIHHREREREPAPPYQCHCQAIASAYNGSTAFAIWRCTAVCSQWRCQCKGYMAGVSRVEKREHEKAEKQTTQDNFGELFTSNRIFRQKRKNQFRIKINIFFPLILRSPSLSLCIRLPPRETRLLLSASYGSPVRLGNARESFVLSASSVRLCVAVCVVAATRACA